MPIKKQQLIELAKKYETPLYVYDGNLIIQKYNELKKLIPWPKLKIYYAMKANYNFFILKLLLEQGAFIDAVSLGDVLLAKKAGFSSEKILFTANKITDKEMHLAKKENVLFNIDSLSRLEKYCKEYPGTDVCIRFNPMVVAGEHKNVRTGGEYSKFGIFLKDINRVKEITNNYNNAIIGIHEHTGSGIPESVQMLKGMKNLLGIANPENFPELKFVDFGGGFKIPYKPDEKTPDYKKFGKEVAGLFSKTCKKYKRELEMYFEPGKYIVGESGNLLVEVTTIKKNAKKLIAGTNSGFPQLIRPMFYQAYHEIENLTNPDGKIKKYDVVGNICESGDCFGVNRHLPEIREGDVLAIKNAGAYCYSMGGIYNLRPMPAEVLVLNKEDYLVRKRLNYEEMIAQIINESK